jgi:hypothetical protein
MNTMMSKTDVFINVAHGSCHWRGNWIVDDVYGDVPDTAQTTVPEKTAVILIQRDSNPNSGRSNVMLGHRSTGIKKRTYPDGRVVNGDAWMVDKIRAMLSDDENFLRNALQKKNTNGKNNRLAGRRVRPTGRYGKFYYRTYFSGESIPDVSFRAGNNTGLGVYRVVDNGTSTRKMPYTAAAASSYTMKTLLERLGNKTKNRKERTLLVSFSCLDLRLNAGP